MTKAQVGKFFKLARAAHANAAPDQPFDGWRKAEMHHLLGVDSVFLVDVTWGYDTLMGHFAVLACDFSACAYFADAAERRIRWVLDGMVKDLEWLQFRGVEESYIAAIYRQAGMTPSDFKDATLRDLMTLIPMLDTRIRHLAGENGHALKSLPTAGAPWYFRGQSAGRFRDYMDRLRHQAEANAAHPVFQKEVCAA